MPVLNVLRPEFDRATAADQRLDVAISGLVACVVTGLSALLLGNTGFAGCLMSEAVYFFYRWLQARQAWKLYYSIAYRTGDLTNAPHD